MKPNQRESLTINYQKMINKMRTYHNNHFYSTDLKGEN